MVIGGLQKTSLIDFPGKISAVVFTAGCNFRCPYCHNPDLVNPESPQAGPLPQEVLSFLSLRRGRLEAVVISGGEPFLQPDLMDFCREVRSLGYFIKIDTNGSRPGELKQLLDAGLADYVAMDVKTDPKHYAPELWPAAASETILESIRILKTSAPDFEFRTTCVQPFIDAGVMETIARHIEGAPRYVLQRFQSVEILRPDFFDGVDPRLSAQQMQSMAAIASRYVARCIIR